MENVYYVYEHYTKDTNEIFYVGYGKQNRAYDFVNRNRFWKFVYEKHGVEVKLIKTNLLLDEAIKLECELIKTHGRRDLGLGNLVNLTDGGEGLKNASLETRQKLSYIASNISEETREKMRKSAKNKPPMSEKTKELLREKFSGKNNPNYGKEFTEEHRRKLSESHKGIKLSEKTKEKLRTISTGYKHTLEARQKISNSKKRKVSQFTSDNVYIKTFDSISEAVKITGVKNVSACVRGVRNFSGGYIWKYEDLNND